MKIREWRQSDVPAQAQLAAKTYAETFGHSLTNEELSAQIEETRSETYFRSLMGRDTVLVATLDDQLVGYIQLGDVGTNLQGVEPGPNDQAVQALYVDADHQGRGIGRSLMDAAFAHPRLRESDHVFIDVWGENKRALAFYQDYGFEAVGTRDVTADGKVIGQDLVLMRPSRTD
ncbi:MAG: N-acetyltransferase [Planctomycetota bacterium]